MAQQGTIRYIPGKGLVMVGPEGVETPLGSQAAAPPGLLQPPPEVPGNRQFGPTNAELGAPDFDVDDLRAGLTMLGKGVETGIGFAPGPPAVKALLSGIVSAGVGGLEGGLEGARDRAALNMGAELSAPWLGQAIPRAGVNTGLWLGSLRGSLGERIPDITDAFMRVREATKGNMFKELPIGAQARTTQARQAAGRELAAAEEAVPGRPVDLSLLAQSLGVKRTRSGIPSYEGKPSYLDELRTSATPVTNQNRAREAADRIIDEHLYIRPGSELTTARAVRRVPQRRDAADPMVSVRDAREIVRALRAEGPGPQQIIKMRTAGQPVEQGADIDAHVRDILARDLDGLARSAPGARLEGPTQLVSDLKTMETANRALRGGGTTLKDLGLIGVRGGLGSGIGYSIARLLGLDPTLFSAAGGMGGLFASPANISRAGYLGGRAAEYAPTSARSYDLATDVEDYRERRAKRREPKK